MIDLSKEVYELCLEIKEKILSTTAENKPLSENLEYFNKK